MNAIEIRDVSYRYPEREGYALRGLNLTVREGEFALITGSSGCGKSTLCRLLNGLIPYHSGGTICGSVMVNGLDVAKHNVAELSAKVGMLFQDPESQIVMSEVEDEIAFGLENMQINPAEIGERIKWVTKRLEIEGLMGRKTSELSGGEKQKVVLASILSMKPRILALDEPTSQLDPPSRASLFGLLDSLNSEGMTIVLVEHNIKEALMHADYIFDLDSQGGIRPPTRQVRKPTPGTTEGVIMLDVKGLHGGYPGRKVLEGVSLQVRDGECLAVLGDNGSGKTTLAKHLCGLMKPIKGSVVVCGLDTRCSPIEDIARKVAYLPQNPSDMLFCDTVEDELRFTLTHSKVVGDIEATLERYGLTKHSHSYPRDLSVGEKQRLALAAVLIKKPKLAILDEPTRGIDWRMREVLITTIGGMLSGGCSVVLITQDERLVDEVSTGRIKLGGDVFGK